MKKINKHIMLFHPTTIIVLLYLMSFTGVLSAQNLADSKPTAETEIICYAAKKQWVCAPADQKQQAHDKAMILAAQNKPTNDNQSSTNNSEIEIKTLDVNNDFSQLVEETPVRNPSRIAAIEEQIKDFTPREDAQDPQQVNAENISNQATTSADVAADVTSDVQGNDSDSGVTEQASIEAVEIPQPANQSSDFKNWQANYAEKWSFQVIGTSNRHQLDQFLSGHDLIQRDHSIVKTQANSADWWVVLVGLFDSRDEALSQRYTLPDALAQGAWVRQIKTIDGEAD
jgi:hypothetical protein